MRKVGSAPAGELLVEEAAKSAWYMDAVIYQIHVRAFQDSDGDGIGDFRGLTQRLDYIRDLGVTAIWLLPFFPSPLRDDGYDIADFFDVNPMYGTLKDFKAFLREAHRRDLRVITELVMNHTSDTHAWFQRARKSPPGSTFRDFYVWSDDPTKYKDARIIFQDFETSNWSWDPVAQAYYWHRFYSHQPDLNFDNPAVHDEMFRVVDYWFGMGVDGVRLDAVPYLYEREGTNCENLPETHEFLRKLRTHVDHQHPDRMLLAEANQWPEDAVRYFGDGDECQMNFHFPLMPRLFMAIEREDRFPILDIMDQTPPVPDGCQWAIFLRNHDELTLEMVTDEERDYMYRAYASDPQARVNLGIRRRLAPLLKNNRRKIELMCALLLSLPGTPIIYYGDEIGMGDNIYLGDRDGVRTPMQWSTDRNAGFSRGNPQQLYLPTIIDSEYHYSTCNVEIQHNSPHSLLWWTRRIIHLRKQHNVFGAGSLTMLTPDNSKVLAFIRQFQDETLLVVANLSRFVQCVELDLSQFRGQTPVELFGQTHFPPIGELPYFLTIGPHGFYWFQLRWSESEAVELSSGELPECRSDGSWQDLMRESNVEKLEEALPTFLASHRWYAGKAKTVRQVSLADAVIMGNRKARAESAPYGILLARVEYLEGDSENYLVPLVIAVPERADQILGDHPNAGVLQLRSNQGERLGTLCEATWERDFWVQWLLALKSDQEFKGTTGQVQPELLVEDDVGTPRSASPNEIVIHGGEQSNTSVVFDNRTILKMFRRVAEGENPDLEIGRHLAGADPPAPVPNLLGAWHYRTDKKRASTIAVLNEYVANEGDTWVFTIDELSRYLERVQSEEILLSEGDCPADSSLLDCSELTPTETAQRVIGPYLHYADILGTRTAQLHTALASADGNPSFAPEPFSKLYQRSLYQSLRSHARQALGLLRRRVKSLPADCREVADQILQMEGSILSYLQNLMHDPIVAQRCRCHGDFHLGQILYTGKDFVIIDFEGEPDRPISQRRIKTSPLRDVAGMIRSFHYASHAIQRKQAPGLLIHRGGLESPQRWLQMWYIWTSAVYLRAYLSEADPAGFLPPKRQGSERLLNAFLLEKSLYEMSYELNNRPDWVRIPLQGILQLMTQEQPAGDDQ